MTKPFYPMKKTTSAVIPMNTFQMSGLARTDIERELNRIASLDVSPGMRPRVCLTVLLDLSGSMGGYYGMMKHALTKLVNSLRYVNNRQFSLHIIVINKGRAFTVFFGDLKQLDVENFVRSLPRPDGMTPYAEALKMGMDLQDELTALLEQKGHWYNPCEVYLTITDCLANDKDGSYAAAITRKLSEKAKNGTALLTEFVTQNNRQGLVTGGYKVYMDQDSSEQQINEYAKALRTGTSSDASLTEATAIPDVRERTRYIRYLADRLLSELNAAFQRAIRPVMKGD